MECRRIPKGKEKIGSPRRQGTPVRHIHTSDAQREKLAQDKSVRKTRGDGRRRLTCSHGYIQGLKPGRQGASGQNSKEQLAGGKNLLGQTGALTACRTRDSVSEPQPDVHMLCKYENRYSLPTQHQESRPVPDEV